MHAIPFMQSTQCQLCMQCRLCNTHNAIYTYNAICATHTMPIVHTMPFMQFIQCQLCTQCHLFCETMPNMRTMPFMQSIQCQMCKQCHFCNILNANYAYNAICAHNAIFTSYPIPNVHTMPLVYHIWHWMVAYLALDGCIFGI